LAHLQLPQAHILPLSEVMLKRLHERLIVVAAV